MTEIKLHARIISKLVELNNRKNETQIEINKMVGTILDQEGIDFTNKKITLSQNNDSIIVEDINPESKPIEKGE